MVVSSRRVIVVVFPGVQALDVVGPADVFSSANDGAGHRLYRVVLASASGGSIPTSAGYGLPTRRLSALRPGRRDTVLVAGGDEPAIVAALSDGRVGAWVAHAAAIVERFGSTCSGAFLLAAVGLLDGKRVATHWSACDRLVALCPRANVDSDAIFVQDGRLWTSAGVTTGIDMALAIVEADHGHRKVDDIAAKLVLYARRPGFQSQWSTALVAQRSGSAPLAPLIGWARSQLDQPLDVNVLARRAGLSLRTLHRRCLAELGTTPARLITMLRMECARTLLATSRLSAKEIAAQCGLRDGAQLARMIRRGLGVAPREYRAMFGVGIA